MTQYLQVKSHIDGQWHWMALGPPLHLVARQADASPLEDDLVSLLMEVWKVAAPNDELRLVIVEGK